jgi:hypothetical protein
MPMALWEYNINMIIPDECGDQENEEFVTYFKCWETGIQKRPKKN